MKPSARTMTSFGRLLAVSLLATQVAGHSWIEQLVNLSDNGTYVGDFGYARNFQDKGDPANIATVQQHDKYMLPPTADGQYITAQQPICPPTAQKPGQDAAGKFPKLQTAPGNYIAMRYAENGHVSQPMQLPGKPSKAGTNYVFGTTNPKEGDTLANVLLWTADGKGGDGNGKLLSAQTFDDGRCYEMNPTNAIVSERMKVTPNKNFPLYCETDFQIPTDSKTGQELTLYWVWQWPTMPNITSAIQEGKDEYYMSCIDVDVVDSTSINATAERVHTLMQQDANTVAVSDFKSRTAEPSSTNPTVNELGTIFKSGKTAAPTGARPTGAAPSTGETQPTPSSAAPSGTAPRSATGAPVSTLNGPTDSLSGIGSATVTEAIPTITNRPGHPAQSSGQNLGGGDAVTVTVTEHVTVTAPLSIATVTKRALPDEDKSVYAYTTTAALRQRDSAKFRGRL